MNAMNRGRSKIGLVLLSAESIKNVRMRGLVPHPVFLTQALSLSYFRLKRLHVFCAACPSHLDKK